MQISIPYKKNGAPKIPSQRHYILEPKKNIGQSCTQESYDGKKVKILHDGVTELMETTQSKKPLE
jgi:hypothetical protein